MKRATPPRADRSNLGCVPRVTDHASEAVATSAVLEAVHRATPNRRLTVLALLEHPKLLDAVDMMLTELQEGLR